MFQTLQNILLVCMLFPLEQSLCARSLHRDSKFRVASFIDHVFHVLDVLELESRLVRDRIDCQLHCLEDQRCFSTNLATKPDINSRYVCKLLPTDKYNASDSFRPSPRFHHYSVKVYSCRALYQLNDFWCGDCHPNYSGSYCEKWLVEIPYHVCMYGKGDMPGVFFTLLAGKIYSIRLVHISGKVGCTPEDESNWGYHSDIDTILTDKDNNVVFPEDHNATYYQLPGFTGNSPELVLSFTIPLLVTAGQEYRLWYWEDLVNHNDENNNPGPSCMKVIYLFSD
ncbi:uncharacterized protein LOC111339452 [Stylophora pistillata]|uniref:uncharacterized protein LOC111339452 n=1 Tax=Stylophora pistillata TaxID=50429 RepID=UPI000C03E099|nr:uncharacterized protein LOC111339452 [Stylophora pistillata]